MTRKELEHTQTSNGPIRVCFIAPKAYPLFNPAVKKVFGGAEVDLYFLATELAKDESFTVSFITADYGQEKVKAIKNVKVIKSLSFRENPLAGAIKVWRAMRTADTRIYFQEAASWGTFLAALFCKLHKAMFVYRSASQRECDGTYLRQHYFAGKAFRWSLRTAAQVVVQNEADQEGLERTIGVHSIVIPNAHHLPVLSDSNRDTVLWVGRSVAVKRPELFIDLAEKMPDEHFTMICQRATGDDKYEELVERAGRVKNLEFIKRVGFDQVESYFQRAKVFVNTSESEGFPNTFIQACKCAAPVLSLRVNPDNFLSKYKCGICADDDWGEFVQQLRAMLESGKLTEYGKNARQYAERKHDIRRIIENYKELLLSLKSSKA